MRATRLFVRRAMPDLYFNRVPSLPATDDGSARPLTEDLSTGSDDGNVPDEGKPSCVKGKHRVKGRCITKHHKHRHHRRANHNREAQR